MELLTCADPLVLVEVCTALEGSATVEALTKLLPCVDLVTLTECGTLPKGLPHSMHLHGFSPLCVLSWGIGASST